MIKILVNVIRIGLFIASGVLLLGLLLVGVHYVFYGESENVNAYLVRQFGIYFTASLFVLFMVDMFYRKVDME